jgi:hypothetical protein
MWIEKVRNLVEFFVEQHNTRMPYSAFAGHTPDGMYFGTSVDLPVQLSAARIKARKERLAANQAMTCDQCSGQPTSSPTSQIPPWFQHCRCCVRLSTEGLRTQLYATRMRDDATAPAFRRKFKPRVQTGSATQRLFPHYSLIRNEGRRSKAIGIVRLRNFCSGAEI